MYWYDPAGMSSITVEVNATAIVPAAPPNVIPDPTVAVASVAVELRMVNVAVHPVTSTGVPPTE